MDIWALTTTDGADTKRYSDEDLGYIRCDLNGGLPCPDLINPPEGRFFQVPQGNAQVSDGRYLSAQTEPTFCQPSPMQFRKLVAGC